MNNDFLQFMWYQAEMWRILLALFGGTSVGYVYFKSLRWSINHLSESNHKFGLFAMTALFRILLFFAVMVLIANKNVVVILFYLLAFFITKLLIVWHEKKRFIVPNHKE